MEALGTHRIVVIGDAIMEALGLVEGDEEQLRSAVVQREYPGLEGRPPLSSEESDGCEDLPDAIGAV